MKSNFLKTIIASILTLPFMLCVSALTAPAATFTVNQSSDAGDFVCDATCTLRDAVTAAGNFPSDDTIVFDAALSNVYLTGEIAVNGNFGTLSIVGNGASNFAITGVSFYSPYFSNISYRLFYFNNAAVTITDATLTGGDGFGTSCDFQDNDPNSQFAFGLGGAICSDFAAVTLNRVNVAGNSALSGGGIVSNYGSVHILNSTFNNNTADSCGAIGDASYNFVIVNSTISGNVARQYSGGNYYPHGGGGLCLLGINAEMRNVTVTANHSPNAGGIYFRAHNLNLGNTIVAGNTAEKFPEIENNTYWGTITSLGGNLIGDAPGEADDTDNRIIYEVSDILDTPPYLGALQNNGGSTSTHALRAGSPAINGGDNRLAVDPYNNSSLLQKDQRDYLRRLDNVYGRRVDIGAYEYGAAPRGIRF